MSFAAVYDACVLYPFEVRDILMYSAYSRLFRVHWSEEILNECTRNLIKDGRATPESMIRMTEGMNQNFRDANTPREDYEHLVETMTCHKKDRHVLAVAVVGKTDVIVTYNHGDFPKSSLEPYRIQTLDPDDFVLDVIDLDPELFMKWYHKMVNRRIERAKKLGLQAPSAESVATYLAKDPMPKTGECVLDLLTLK